MYFVSNVREEIWSSAEVSAQSSSEMIEQKCNNELYHLNAAGRN